MARLFGLIAPRPIDLTIALSSQYSPLHRSHGWGIGSYDRSGKPQIFKGKRSAMNHQLNQEVKHTVATNLAIVHTRIATSGTVSDQNTHPFSYKNWLFCHSGTIYKDELMQQLKPPFNQNFQSEPIDSEIYFRLIMQSMKEKGEMEGLKFALKTARDTRGANFLLTDGQRLFAYRYGLPMYYLRWKTIKPLNIVTHETGVIYQSQQIAQTQAFIIASEILTTDNWNAFDDGELLIVQKNLTYQSIRIV